MMRLSKQTSSREYESAKHHRRQCRFGESRRIALRIRRQTRHTTQALPDPDFATSMQTESRFATRKVLRASSRLSFRPAWTDVWICPIPNGHLQATGRDARGRKQSRYHPRWRQVRDETKYEHMMSFGKALPVIRERVEHDLSLSGLPRPKILATIVRLMETTYIRVGNQEYARHNKSYGLTTMRGKHVEVHGSAITFTFPGKSGVHHAIDLEDRRLARIVHRVTTQWRYRAMRLSRRQEGNVRRVGRPSRASARSACKAEVPRRTGSLWQRR